ncbi:hypothetical protein [Xanthomonas oryzae]
MNMKFSYEIITDPDSLVQLTHRLAQMNENTERGTSLEFPVGLNRSCYRKQPNRYIGGTGTASSEAESSKD